MLSRKERNALTRLMRGAVKDDSESRVVAYWLLKAEGAEDIQGISSEIHGLSAKNASDVETVAEAMRRENKHITDLGGFESVCSMTNIVESMGLPVTRRCELREWLATNRL